MDLVAQYNSDSEGASEEERGEAEEEQEEQQGPSSKGANALALVPNTAPDVDAAKRDAVFVDPFARKIAHNARFEEMYAPFVGPTEPFKRDSIAPGMKNHLLGYVEDDAIDSLAFSQQFHTFQSFGYAHDPASGANIHGVGLVGDADMAAKLGGGDVFNTDKRKKLKPSGEAQGNKGDDKGEQHEAKPLSEEQEKVVEACKAVHSRCLDGEFDFDSAIGPFVTTLLDSQPPAEVRSLVEDEFKWDAKARAFSGKVDRVLLAHQLATLLPTILGDEAEGEGEGEGKGEGAAGKKKGKGKGKKRKFEDAGDIGGWKGPWAKPDIAPAGLSEEQRRILEEQQAGDRQARGEEPQVKKALEAAEASTIFHGDAMFDYQGRTYVHPPSDLRPVEQRAFLPKTLIHQWEGHTKGVHAVRLFPKYGHIMISAGMDSKIKLWDMHNDRRCLRTFLGHSGAVRDLCFSNDGRRFLSASYDRFVRLWDTETGKVLGTFTNKRIPYVVKLHPDDDKQNEFVVGGSDKKIVQWDVRTKEIVQEYNLHLGAVNTITFIDENRRFVSSSDDKSLRVWEWGIPVAIKYICEPHMHSMPAITPHPNNNWVACQSLDNQILLYSTKDRFKLNRKRRFVGHMNAGYACQINFSPDGRFIMSGDGNGKLFFWDFKSGKKLKYIDAHKGVCIGCVWHPCETSKVVTCGWDGAIRYWD